MASQSREKRCAHQVAKGSLQSNSLSLETHDRTRIKGYLQIIPVQKSASGKRMLLTVVSAPISPKPVSGAQDEAPKRCRITSGLTTRWLSQVHLCGGASIVLIQFLGALKVVSSNQLACPPESGRNPHD
jgi:hypothetical protein